MAKPLVGTKMLRDILTGFENKLSHHPAAFWGHVVFKLCCFALLLILAVLFSSCSTTTLLPRHQKIIVTPWNSFSEAKNAFDQIDPYQTKKDELEKLGFAPQATPNIKILN